MNVSSLQKKAIILITLFFSFSTLSCIYTFSGGFPRHLRKVFIQPFENTTDKGGVGPLLTESFVDAVQKDGRLTPVIEKQAGLIIKPRLIAYSRTPFTYNENQEVLSYKVTLKAVIYSITNDTSYINDTTFTGWSSYDASSETEDEGIQKATSDLVRVYLDKLFRVKF